MSVSWGQSAHQSGCVTCCASPFLPMYAARSGMSPGVSATVA